MRICVLAMFLLTSWAGIAAAQEIAAPNTGASEPVMVPAAVGTIVRGYMQDPAGQAVVAEVQVAGSSPDELFTYWVGSDGHQYYGFDVYREVWRPSPASYVRATLLFQNTVLEGWLRSFGGLVDRDFFFGDDGVVYQRFYNEFNGLVAYTYFVHTATGQRSDNLELMSKVVNNAELTQLILAEQAAQQEQFFSEFAERGEDYAYWRQKGNTLPAELPSLVSWGEPSAGLSRDLPEGQPNLLELIEEEVGPLNPEEKAALEAGSEPDATAEPTDAGAAETE